MFKILSKSVQNRGISCNMFRVSFFSRTQCRPIYVCVWYIHTMRVSREKMCYCIPIHAHTHTHMHKTNLLTNTAINADHVRRGCLHIFLISCFLLIWINYYIQSLFSENQLNAIKKLETFKNGDHDQFITFQRSRQRETHSNCVNIHVDL